jgi:PBP1b-binding outer membrane lipoprotein LpoB
MKRIIVIAALAALLAGCLPTGVRSFEADPDGVKYTSDTRTPEQVQGQVKEGASKE